METASELKEQLRTMLLEADRLLESHPILRLMRWIDMADAVATNDVERAAFKKEVKRLVSTWSGPSLKDYSARVWSGLICDYYVPRMDYYYEKAIAGEYADMVEFDNRFHYGTGYGSSEDVCPDGQDIVSPQDP